MTNDNNSTNLHAAYDTACSALEAATVAYDRAVEEFCAAEDAAKAAGRNDPGLESALEAADAAVGAASTAREAARVAMVAARTAATRASCAECSQGNAL